ncbi:rhomboid family intramembrane serine protease [Myxococcota bacterium]|nr:rhomboid family intramembrane serine protease [Myxococcota bacterium]
MTRFPVRPAALWDQSFTTALLVSLGVFWLAFPFWSRAVELPAGPGGAVRLTISAVMAFGAAWLFTRQQRRPGEAITLSDDGIRLPPALTGGAAVEPRWETIRGVGVQGANRDLRIVLSTRAGRHVIPLARLEAPDDFLALLNVLLALAERVPAPERMRVLAAVEQALEAPPEPRPIVTVALLGACLGVGAYAQWGVSASHPAVPIAYESLIFGGNQPALVRDGQWFRLVTANYLHGGAAHLVMNLLSLFSVGRALERMLGRRALLSLFLFAGLTGALASTALAGPTSPRFSVGASTSLFGLVGALAVTQLRFRAVTPAHLLPSGDFWRNTLFMNALLVFAAPNIDHMGHLGGALGGAALTWVLGVRPFRADERPSGRLWLATGALAAVHAAGFAVALARGPEARRVDAEHWLALLEAARPPR